MTTTQRTVKLSDPVRDRDERPLGVRLVGGPDEFVLPPAVAVTFGRSRTAQVVLDDASVSKLHFGVRALDVGAELEDLDSKNGTWFKGRRVQRITLMPGDRFWAGACELELFEVGRANEVAPASECGLLFGESVAMRELFAAITKFAAIPLDILIEGETGTGKELTARTLHALSPRARQPFVVLDCSTLSSSLADAAMFGFRRGSFTGAEYDQAGLFEQAHGGTLFIDEIGELSPELQMKFLRALDRREVARIGEPGKLREVDVRVLAASNRDLAADMQAGRFREDLFHRVAHARLRLPSLCERGFDGIALAERFVRELGDPYSAIELGDDAKAALLTYAWPGNVRELRHTIRRAALTCRDGLVRLDDLELGRPQGIEARLAKALGEGRSQTYESLHLLVDRVVLPSLLEQHESLAATARQLGITRVRLRERLKALGLYDVRDKG